MMVSFGGAACWLYLFPMALPINSCMPDYTQHYCTFQCGDTKTYENVYIYIICTNIKINMITHKITTPLAGRIQKHIVIPRGCD